MKFPKLAHIALCAAALVFSSSAAMAAKKPAKARCKIGGLHRSVARRMVSKFWWSGGGATT